MFTREDVLTGLMLGDGCLYKHPHCKNSILSICRNAADAKYLLWTSEFFSEFMSPASIKYSKVYDKRTTKTYNQIILRTLSNPFFTQWHNRWYPNAHKSIPSDLVLNENILKVWFADDGSVACVPKYHRFDTKLATHGFSKDEVYFLKSLIDSTFGIKFHVYKEKDKEQYTLRLFKRQECRQFFRIIDTDFPLDRKSKIWRESPYDVFHDPKPSPVCIYCNKEKTYKNGHNKNKQMWLCTGCGRQFSETSKPRKEYKNCQRKLIGEYWKS